MYKVNVLMCSGNKATVTKDSISTLCHYCILLTGSQWDVSILQPYPLHSCLTYYVFLLLTPNITLHFSFLDNLTVPLLIFQFWYTLPLLSETT